MIEREPVNKEEQSHRVDTLLPKGIVEKARAHEILYDSLIRNPAGDEPDHVFKGVRFGLRQYTYIALSALRDDIQNAIAEIAKEYDARFWYEVWGPKHSTCKYSVSGFCDAYHGNDGADSACSYAYVHDVECCACLRTKSVEQAYPDLFRELVVDNVDTKGIFYGECEPEIKG